MEIHCVFRKVRPESLFRRLTLILLTTTIVAPPSNASKWQMGFNSAFKGLIVLNIQQYIFDLTHSLNNY
jgi:hypothetical protein